MDSQCKCFSEMLTENLYKSLGDDAGNNALGIVFAAENPAGRDNFGIWRCFNDLSGGKLLDLSKFLFHSSLPFHGFCSVDGVFGLQLVI